ncbi:MAG: WD40 repeat domain-containing serine/threonine protein kinase, partial [Gemmataceae bacterium]
METTSTSTARERQLRTLCAELERRLRAGEDCHAAGLLEAHPALADDPESAVELIYAEYVCRESLGQQLGSEAFCARYARWADALHEQLRVHALMADCLDGAGKPAAAPRAGGLTAGAHFGPYLIVRELGRGGSGVVYLARDERLKRQVAVKVLLAGPHSSEEQVQRLHREAELVAGLQHPHFVQVYEVGTHEGWKYVALEYVTGTNLDERLAQGPLPPRQAAELVKTLAVAIHFAHEHGIVHRDLKPANVLLSADGVPRITDLGLAMQLLPEQASTRSGSLTGTPSYMAPEQAQGSSLVGPAADVYCLGAVLYHALVGRAPFLSDSTFETLEQVIHEEPVPPRRLRPSMPRDLETICLKCLRKSAAQRYESAALLADDLQRFLEQRPIQARPISGPERLLLWARRKPLVAALSAVLFLSLIALLIGSFWHGHSLQVALDETERQRQRAQDQQAATEKQLRRTERGQFALQLAQVQQLWQQDPGRGLELLDDEERCPPGLRDFTWHYLRRLCDRQRFCVPSAGQSVVALLPTAGVLVVGDESGRARLHDLESGEERTTFATGQPIRALAVSKQDGVALGRGDGTVEVWSLEPPRLEHRLALHTGSVLQLLFAHNGRHLFSSGADGLIQVWNLDKNEVEPLRGHQGAVVALALSEDGQTLASCNVKRELWLWDIDKGTKKELPVASDGTRALAFVPGSHSLAAGGDSEEVHLYDSAAGKMTERLQAHFSPVLSLSFNAKGNLLAAGCKDGGTLLWNFPRRELLTTFKGHRAAVASVALGHEPPVLVSAGSDGAVRAWNIAVSGTRHLRGHEEPIITLALSPDGTRLVSSSFDQTLRVWDLASGKQLASHRYFRDGKTMTSMHRVRGIVFARDGKSFYSASELGTIYRWDSATGQPIGQLFKPKSHKEPSFFALTLSHDGKNLICGTADGHVELRSADTGELRQRFAAHGEAIAAVALSGAGRLLATGSLDRSAALWKLPEGTLHVRLTGHTNWVQGVAFAPDGKVLATASADETIRLWDPATGNSKQVLSGHSQAVNSVAFTPDGATLFSGTGDRWRTVPGEVKFWDAGTGYVRATFAGEAGPVVVAPAGNLLATGSADGSIRLWTAASPQPRLN